MYSKLQLLMVANIAQTKNKTTGACTKMGVKSRVGHYFSQSALGRATIGGGLLFEGGRLIKEIRYILHYE